MKKYHCYGRVEGSKYLGEIEASNLKEAIRKALDLEEMSVSFCNYCSGECEDPMVTRVIVESEDLKETAEEDCF